MLRKIALAFIILAITAVCAPAQASRNDDLTGAAAPAIRQALAQVGLTMEGCTFDLSDRDFYSGDRYRLRFFDTLIADPWKIPAFTPVIRDGAFTAAKEGSLSKLVQAAQVRLNGAVRLGLTGDVMEPYTTKLADTAISNHLVDAIKACYAAEGKTMDASEETYLTERAAVLPKEISDAAALYFYALPDVLAYHDAAFDPVRTKLQMAQLDDPARELLKWMTEESDTVQGTAAIKRDVQLSSLSEYLMDDVDWGYLNTGATLLALVTEKVHNMLKAAQPVADYEFTFDTPWGMVALNGNAVNTYGGSLPYLLIIDSGGDDAYQGGGVSYGFGNPASVLLDLAGNDAYTCETPKEPCFGAGVFGYGMLIDCAGDDTYAAQDFAMGCGVFGTGVLLDEGGNDTYLAVTNSEGAGVFGTGVLADASGNDIYDCYTLSQGYGYTMGAGLLADLAGDDKYTANDTDIRYPSAQSKDHNSSLAQGCGFGRRGDYTTGHSWAGGVGMLFDAAGNDAYSCAVFGQGVGYWYGTGILADAAGNDDYHGHWYVQASAAHFALGVLDDAAGDDHYFADMNMAIGAGHDFSLGFLVDRAGNDVYEAPNLSLGGGNANGIGIFWDMRGDDAYKVAPGTTLGRANIGSRGGLRDYFLNIGLFIDTGGNDTYPPELAFAANNKMWKQRGTDETTPLPLVELGVGVDAEVAGP